MAQAKTIVITTAPMTGIDMAFRGLRPPCTTTAPIKMASLLPRATTDILRATTPPSDAQDEDPVPRKRQRLTHLSLEQKIQRRKLKNRVAAQSARDRKKARMQDLEEVVKALEKEGEMMASENDELRLRNVELERENAELRQRLGLESTKAVSIKKEPVEESPVPENNCCSSVEHASFINDPLPKGQEQATVGLWMMLYAGWLMLNLMSSWKSLKGSAKNLEMLNATSASLKALRLLPDYKMKLDPGMKWWGPHQQSWNPSKN